MSESYENLDEKMIALVEVALIWAILSAVDVEVDNKIYGTY